jgi:Transposase IS116/IS110/IS902 family
MSTPAVGPIVSLTFACAIDDPSRFTSSKQVGPYLGLTPKKYQSGETDYTGRISRHGDVSVREALYEAAHLMLTKPIKGCSELKSWATRIVTRRPQYYEPIRLPTAPDLTFTGLRLVPRSGPRDRVSRVAPVVYVPSSLPRWNRWVPVALFPSNASFPCISARSASTSIFSRPAQRSLALQPAHSRSHLMTLSIGSFSWVIAFPTAPIATGRSDPCREGLAPSQEPCLSTAHTYT